MTLQETLDRIEVIQDLLNEDDCGRYPEDGCNCQPLRDELRQLLKSLDQVETIDAGDDDHHDYQVITV